ncbi:hypothetical protein L1049_015108 [Liquidambar formosana]|uniref:Uncharacterized protein n=1 Tax=Liquidambar formosana TaxID=63359 RepID=A0AAP0X6A7_LIQFO
MSGLVDKLTSELAKLREKGSAIFSSGSSPTTLESSQVVRAQEEGSLTRSFSGLTRIMRLNPPVFLSSEASVSMLVECFSP